MSSFGSATSSVVTSFFIVFFSLIFLFFPNTASAVTTEEHFAYRVYINGGGWWQHSAGATAGGVNGTYGKCDVDNPILGSPFAGDYTCIIIWDFRGFPEIPVGSTINKLVVKTYANTSGNSGQFSIGFEGGKCDISDFTWQNNITSYLIPKGKCGYDLYTHADIHGDFSISNHYVAGKPNHINLDAISIYVDYTPPQSPTPTPTATPTPTPTPAGPEPFLDLPWNYDCEQAIDPKLNEECKKIKPIKEFSFSAQKINSYFDHKYPFLCCGVLSSLDDLVIINYRNEYTDIGYSLHDGYDYGRPALVEDGDPVLAAASGEATFIHKDHSGGGGYVIKIDHENGYQTVYEHIKFDEYIIVNNESNKVRVQKGQRIGSVGHDGNCWVQGANGIRIHNTADCAHIHFSVVQDKEFNNSNNYTADFYDNMPDGLTDPYGWQPSRNENEKDDDPWEKLTFSYKGKERTGNKSYYLWTEKLPGVKDMVTSVGGKYTAGEVSVEVEPDTFENPVTLEMDYVPNNKASNSIWSVGPVISITAKNLVGDLITLLTKPVQLRWQPFKDVDLARFKPGTFYLYSSKDGLNWTRETEVNPFIPGDITVAASHFIYFAIMGERKDMLPPVTKSEIQGLKGQDNWFRSDVNLLLTAFDEADIDPAGVRYMYYKINDGDWVLYPKQAVSFTNEGHYVISYYASDYDGNIESVKTVEFDIDKTLPTVEIKASPFMIWPPNGKMVDVQITGNGTDENLKGTIFKVIDEYGRVEPEIQSFDQIIQLEAKRDGNDGDGRVYTIQAKTEDLAGNMKEATTTVIVPHDQDK